MIAELSTWLTETTLAVSAALLLVLLLRRSLRTLFGARSAYLLWLLVPAAVVAVLLPPRSIVMLLPDATGVALAPLATTAAVAPPPGSETQPWLLATWLLGACSFGVWIALRQGRFVRALGRLHARGDGSWLAESTTIGPAVIGLWRGRIVLPADFDARYTQIERDLVLRHERIHVQRWDLTTSLVATALRCVCWFNPLVHYAFGRFRFDQELATDAAVLAHRPDARRPYADAMLKTQLLFEAPPLGCHWQSEHPLKERIAMLKRPLPGFARLVTGVSAALLLSATTGYVAWASQPAQLRVENTSRTVEAPANRELQWASNGARPASEDRASRKLRPPRYPADALKRRVEGTVVLKIKVSRDGKALETQLDTQQSSPNIDSQLVAAAQESVLAWQFESARDASGEAIEQWVSVPITFELPAPPNSAVLDVSASYARVSPPKYPAGEALEGTVLLRVLVSEDGAADEITVERSSGHATLDTAATSAVRRWRFNPATTAGKARAQHVAVPIEFTLGEPSGSPDPGPTSPQLDAIWVRKP